MLYRATRDLALRIMKAPTEPPDPPSGSHGSTHVYRASPRYLTYRLLALWVVMGLLSVGWCLLVGVGLANDESAPLIVAGFLVPFILAILFFGYFVVRIDYDMRYYIVTDRSLRVREGAVIVKEQTITFANVQNLRVVQGPLLRLFGIWNLKVDAAGGGGAAEGEAGGGHGIKMAGIESAHEVRDLILGHLKRRGGGAGLGDLDDVGGRTKLAASRELLSVLGELRTAAAALHRAAR